MTLRVSPAEIVEEAELSGAPGLLARAPGWGRVDLGDVARIVNGAAFSSRLFNSEGRGLPLVRIRDVGAADSATYYDGPWEDIHRLSHGDILVGMDGDFRVARWRGGDALLNQRVCRIVVDEGRYDSRFLVLALQGYLDAIWKATSSVTVKHLSSRSIAGIPLPQPSLDEQRRIVEVLEDHLSRLDAADAVLGASAVRLSAWTDRLVEQALHGDWGQHTIGSLAAVGSGATPLKSRRDFYADGTIPWVTSGALNADLVTLPTAFITEIAMQETAVKLWPAGTLLVAMYGEGKTRGRCSELAFPATTNQACAAIVIRAEHEELRPWVKLVLRSRYQRMRRMASGGVQPNLSLGLIKSMAIPVPPPEYRSEVLATVQSADDAARRLRPSISAQAKRSQALRRSLLAAAFSGRLT